MLAPAIADPQEAGPPALNQWRTIHLRLTPFAPQEQMITAWARPADIYAQTLRLLNRRPPDVTAQVDGSGELCICGEPAPGVREHLSSPPDEPVVLAIIWGGMTLADWRACEPRRPANPRPRTRLL